VGGGGAAVAYGRVGLGEGVDGDRELGLEQLG
jgi:hypothetical protein